MNEGTGLWQKISAFIATNLTLSVASIRRKLLNTTHVHDYFSTHSYLVNTFKKNDISLALDFRTFLENMKMSSSLTKILETEINVFKVTFRS